MVEIRVPALRERRDDIPPLSRTFLLDAGERLGRRVSGFTPAAAQQLVRCDWPGNVRELENAVERAVILARDHRIDVDDLPEEVDLALPGRAAASSVRTLHEIERDSVAAVLAANDGNRTRAAQQLAIGAATFYRKIKEYKLPAARD